MKVVDVKFLKSVYKVTNLPKGQMPEIAFSGRSNVGKSSLINTLVNRKGIAKTSSTLEGLSVSILLILTALFILLICQAMGMPGFLKRLRRIGSS